MGVCCGKNNVDYVFTEVKNEKELSQAILICMYDIETKYNYEFKYCKQSILYKTKESQTKCIKEIKNIEQNINRLIYNAYKLKFITYLKEFQQIFSLEVYEDFAYIKLEFVEYMKNVSNSDCLEDLIDNSTKMFEILNKNKKIYKKKEKKVSWKF
jgi:hypothetical protein